MSQLTSAGGPNIDPNTFTPDELLKHTYRLVLEMNAKMDEQKREFSTDKVQHNNKSEVLGTKITVLETRMEEKDKAFKNIITIITVGLSTLSLGLSFLVYFLK